MLSTLLRVIQDIVAPRPPFVRALERMRTEEIRVTLPVAPSTSNISVPSGALFAYRDTRVKHVVWEIKYRKNAAIVQKIGQLLYEKMAAQVEIERRDEKILLVPVAASKQRRRKRGFNQCEVICEAIMRCDSAGQFLYEPRALEKIKHTAHQADLPREKRLENLRGAYTVRTPEKVAGRVVYIIDDVITTGATVSEVASALLAADACHVHAFAIAH